MGESATRGAGKTLVLILVVGAGVLGLVVGARWFSQGPASGDASASKPGASSPPDTRERVFISGSLVNLRESASATANVLGKAPMGTECVVEEKASSGWWRIGCGDSHGWAKSELLSADRPTVEPLLATAEDPKQPLKNRFDAALRATALEPGHAGARTLLWNLFAEQERVQLEKLLAGKREALPQVRLSAGCEGESSTETCLKKALEVGPSGPWHHVDIRNVESVGKNLFVSAELDRSQPPQLWVRAGTIEGDAKAFDIQVFLQSRYAPSDTLKGALEKLPDAHPAKTSERLSKFQAVLTPGEVLMARQLLGTWTQLTRKSQELVIQHSCGGSPRQVRVDETDGRVRIHLEFGQDENDYDVASIEMDHGTTLFRMLMGGTLKHALSREDKRLATWVYSESDSFQGLFVHSSQEDEFPVVQPESCDDL
ncbi:SH3 domain-containing protein [Hyalangium versicolor]|uniref:SH3 domain-containing protein n=1 Tax=Hyalangium versicolor TaxID=2861190 RepID=UPI001CCDCF5A|nr:SH3 domain-containing protein [Hyalangium versicolor]